MAGTAVVALAALLDIVLMTASQTLCQTPRRHRCTPFPLWALIAPRVVTTLVVIAMVFGAVSAVL